MIEAPESALKTRYPLMEYFYTIQGEGFHTGKPAYFIRLGGCDVGCTWCDVKESWPAEAHPMVSVKEMIDFVKASGAELAVITGGEPLMYDLGPLTSVFRNEGIRCHVETSGTHALSGSWDWICFSPKRFKAPLPEFYPSAHELKVVVNHRNDLRWAESHAEKVNSSCLLFLQPEWDKAEELLPLIIDYVKENPKWRISLQTHKYIHVP